MTHLTSESSVPTNMRAVPTTFLPADALATLQKGSHQELAIRVSEAVQANLSRFGGAAHLLATFDAGKAVVMAENGDVYSVTFGKQTDGSVELGPQTLLDVRGVSEKTLRSFVWSEARAAVDLFLQGLTDRANEKIAALLPLVDDTTSLSDTDAVAQFESRRQADRLWKQLVEGKAAQLKKLLGEDKLPEPMVPRFAALYAESDEAPAEEDASEVRVQMEELVRRLNVVEGQAANALRSLSLVKDAAIAEGGATAYKQLEDYALDLQSDVSSVKTFAEEALQDFKAVDLLARLFDAMAGEVAAFEVAGAFATKMASRLADAGR